ncbi:hypothetical protein Desor_4249 [Desulfosporosinus orientis DSM 765]|uniref:Outer membrane protein n=1 Tax=Desulfosporosinus orientis (strain ATCC 19365 / DSM 765 / NCIMB 8382 / VKM B-1628 / Singapore I) TaxID=768706 RepID=G7WIV7_DESOD|nr:hypothetical protein [Desulfosporosinus orientis]AET69682.1 hypothetical protein Desor_4249 [Desulfosporosinus orientis DSM 765]
MKKIMGVSLLLILLFLGRPMMVCADTLGSKIINFEDIESIVTEQNLEVQINENERLNTKIGYAGLEREIKDLEDELEDINDQRDQLSGDSANSSQIISLASEKRTLLDTLKQLERTKVDQPTYQAIADLQAAMNNDAQICSAESLYISYNQAKLTASDLSLTIADLENQLANMQLKESLRLIVHNEVNDLKTELADQKNQLQSNQLTQEMYELQFKNLLNDQENTLVIGSIPEVNQEFSVEDEAADLKKAQENSYPIKLQEQQIVILQAALDRAKTDNGMSSTEYKSANYELTNATLKLAQLQDQLKLDYHSLLEDIIQKQSDLKLAEQTLGDKKAALSDAQLKMGLGMLTKLDLDKARLDYQIQENSVKTKQVELFNANLCYEWLLKGISQS